MQKGVKFGRPVKKIPDDFDLLVRQWRKGVLRVEEVAKSCDMSIATFYRRLRELKTKK